MRYPASEKLQIIQMVEQSHLPVRRTLDKLGIPWPTFYRWYAAYQAGAMLIEMPELGTLDGKQAASLAGLAPISRQSGKWQGKEHIRGGRPLLRRAIYMPALVAVRFNPALKAKYDQLIQAGKPAKVALTAIMRKLIVMANALLRDRRKWAEVSP